MAGLLRSNNHDGTAYDNDTNLNNDNRLDEPLLSSQQQQPQHPEEPGDEPRHDNDTQQPAAREQEEQQQQDGLDLVLYRQIWFFRVLYFCQGLSASTWGRFGIIYYNTICHLSPLRIGWLQGLPPAVSTLAMPIWGVVADRYATRKQVYLFTKACNTLCLLALAWVPTTTATSQEHSGKTFVAVLICVLGMAAFRSSGVLDAAVLDTLGTAHQGKYGSIRLYTAISWGGGAVLMGYITDHAGFVWNFALYGFLMTAMIVLVAMGLPARSKSEQARHEQRQLQQHQQQHHDMEDSLVPTTHHDNHHRPDVQVLKKALLRLPVILWLLQVIIIGTGMAMVDSFLFVYLQNELYASTQLCGWTVGVTVLLELPLFHQAEYLLQHLGHDVLMVVSMMAYIIRAVGYTLLTPSTVHLVLALEILHGVTFACMWIASVDFAATVAPTEWATTVQSILSASFASLGSIIGSLTGGWILQHYGSAVILYRGMAVIVTFVFTCHLLAWWVGGCGHDAFLKSIQRGDSEDDDDNSIHSSSLETAMEPSEGFDTINNENQSDDKAQEESTGLIVDEDLMSHQTKQSTV